MPVTAAAELPPNDALRAARRRLLSPSGSGRPLSRQELAEAANAWLADTHPAEAALDANYIGKLERGKHRWPSTGRRAALRHVLHARTDAELGFYVNRSYRHAEPPPAADLDPHPPMPYVAANADPHRRALLKSIAAVAAGSGLLALTPSTARRRVGAGDVARIEAVTVLYRSMDYECGGGLLCDEVGRLAEAASALLTHADAGAATTRLAAAVAAARQLAGWSAFDAGRHSDAARHWLSAERAALTAADQRLAARIRYCQARQFQHLHHNQDALDTLRLARDQLGEHATPALLATLLGAKAASLAALGDHPTATSALQQASVAFERIDPDREPDWMRFYDRGELLAQYGRVHRDLARHDPRHAEAAVAWTQAAIGAFARQNIRSTVLNEVGLCSALVLAGEPDRAVAVGASAIHHGRALTSVRIQDRIRNLTRDIPADTRRSDLADFRHCVAHLQLAAA
jgi:tetratricopeptide (TPR) repeat protein